MFQEDIDLTRDDASAASNNIKWSKVILTSNEEDSTKPSSGKDEVVNAGIVSNLTKPTVGFKKSANKDKVIEGKVIEGATNDLNLETKDNVLISSLKNSQDKYCQQQQQTKPPSS